MVQSTLTEQAAELVYKFQVDDIVSLYKEEKNIDVSQYFKGLKTIGLYKCLETGYKFYFPLDICGDGKFYESLNSDDSNYYPTWKWENEKAFNYISNLVTTTPKIKILEVGCGEGYFLKKIRSVYPEIELNGLELNDSSVLKLRNEKFNVVNCNIEDYSPQNAETFDFVFAFQVLEHVPDVKSFIDACILTLKPGGLLFFGVPNNDAYIFKNDPYHVLNLPPHHMGLWTYDSLYNLSKHFSIDVSEIAEEPADKNNLGVYFDVFLKKYFSSYRKLFYRIFRFPVKLILKYLISLKGHTVIAVYKKR